MVLPQQQTAFIGRQSEVAEISDLITDPSCRLLTLLGPGGMGKTRMSIEVAQRLLDDGMRVHFVALAPLQSVDSIPTAVAEALDIRLGGSGETPPAQQVLNYLQEKELLLIMDNFEHLLGGVSFVADILDHAPNVKILVTSREVLDLYIEQVYHVKGMSYPDDENITDIDPFSAVKLFIERAQRVRRDFDMQAELPNVIRICKLVDGTPLGIELAAAWLRTLSTQDIINEIQRNIDFLATRKPDIAARHRSIRAVFQQSWEMLTPDERTAFMRASVFRGGFTTNAGQSVTGTSLLTLTALVDKSLLKQISPGRYDIHELLRQYAAEELELASETKSVRDAHSKYYLEAIAALESDIKNHNQLDTFNAIESDFENVISAWYWAIDHKTIELIESAIPCLSYFLEFRKPDQAGIELFNYARVAFAPKDNEKPDLLWAKLLSIHHEDRQNPVGDRRPFLEQCLAIAQEHGDKLWEASFKYQLAYAEDKFGNLGRATDLMEQSLHQFQALNDPFWVLGAEMSLEYFRWRDDRIPDITKFEHLLAKATQCGAQILISVCLNNLGAAYGVRGNFTREEPHYKEAYKLNKKLRPIQDPGIIVVGNLRGLAFRKGNFEEAEQYHNELTERLITRYGLDYFRQNYEQIHTLDLINENYDHIIREIERIRPQKELENHRKWIQDSNLDLAKAHCGLGNYDLARELIKKAQQWADNRPDRIGSTNDCILVAGIIEAQTGDPVRGVELLAFVVETPLYLSGWLEHWPLYIRVRHGLYETLGEEAFNAAWERGASLELDDIVADILKSEDNGLSPIEQANQSLVDPLTNRELEVLQLIAEGLSNQAIADQLFISKSVVRKHINNAYSKLGAESRTHALALARDVGLVE